MHQLYDIEMANALATDRRAEFHRITAGRARRRATRLRLRWRGRPTPVTPA